MGHYEPGRPGGQPVSRIIRKPQLGVAVLGDKTRGVLSAGQRCRMIRPPTAHWPGGSRGFLASSTARSWFPAKLGPPPARLLAQASVTGAWCRGLSRTGAERTELPLVPGRVDGQEKI